FDAVLADVHGQAVAVVGPGAAWAVITPVLMIHVEDDAGSVDQLVLPQQDQADTLGGAPGGGRVVVVLLRERTSGVGAETDRGRNRGLLGDALRFRHGPPSIQRRHAP